MTNDEILTQAKAALEAAEAAEADARKALDDLKASGAGITAAYEAAKKAHDGFKPALNVAKAKLQVATAQVTIARAAVVELDPKAVAPATKGAGNKELLAAVQALLAGKADGMSNQDIWDGLQAQGITMAGANARSNLNAYLHRWGTTGVLVNAGKGRWTAPAAPVAPPAFLTPPEPANVPVEATPEPPAFLAPAPVESDELGIDFPGYEPLKVAGITTKAALAGKTKDDLTAIPGIGGKTADKILAAV